MPPVNPIPPLRAPLGVAGLRRLAALAGVALVLAVGLVVGAGAGGPAGSGLPGARAAAADPTDVFVGVVDRARGAGSGASRYVTFDVTVLSVYLGDISTEEVQVTSTPAFFDCPTRQVERGQQYAFRLVGDGDALVASQCGDVRAATATVRNALGRTYPDVRSPVDSSATFDDVTFATADLGAPMEFTRAAAPGAALVLAGLLGLLVARRFARRPA